MSEQPATPAANPFAAPPVSPKLLRVVLFGMPDAGKSSLLGALAQAAQTQERTLGGRLTDAAQGLADLQHRLYDGSPRETLAETALYPVSVEPFDGTRPDATRREAAVLIDCDGRIANDLLTQRTPLSDDPPDGTLAAEVLAADALLLVVDAGASDAQVEEDLGEFVRFLRLFERDRGRRNEVGGLPVVLVLSKADLLAKPDDTPAAWSARVEQRKAEVIRRFREFLDDEAGAEDARTAFGEIDLTVAATAVHLPALGGSPARPREPWRVAELFRTSLAAARAYRTRRTESQRRLAWTVLASGGFLASLAVAAVALVLNRGATQTLALASKVESYRSREGQTASLRLAEPVERKAGELADLKADPDFAKLDPERREYVETRLAELEAYGDYKNRLQRLRPPADAGGDDELQAAERQLRDDADAPKEFAAEWDKTEAAVLRKKWQDDVRSLRKAAGDVEEYYRGLTTRGDRLLSFADRDGEAAPLPWPRWQESLDALLRDATPPFRESDKLRDARSVAGSRAVTYASVWNYPAVERARGQWDRTRGRLERLRDQANAFGLVAGSKPAVLRLPDRFAADQISDVLLRLKADYPKASEWSLADAPDAAAPELRAAAQASYKRLVAAGRLVVSRLFAQAAPDGKDAPARWRTVGDLASNSAELREWRHLANVLLRFADPQADDPVNALVTFLRRDRFDLDVRGVRLTLPDDIKGQRYRPSGPLVLGDQPPGGSPKSLALRPDGDGTRDSRLRATTYAFSADAAATLAFTPGDAFWAEVPLRDAAGRDWKFSWWSNGTRSASYQLERIELPPRLHPALQKPETGDLADGVVLTPLPERAVPRVPELLPDKR